MTLFKRLPLFAFSSRFAGLQRALQSPRPRLRRPVTFTSDQDHQNMMDQLGIKALRPGPSGDEKAPNHANYDEAKANPYPNVPDPLTHERRPEGDYAGNVVE